MSDDEFDGARGIVWACVAALVVYAVVALAWVLA